MIFSLTNIKKTYNNKDVLFIENLTFKANEVYGIAGPNGSGKTTLLEILCGILKPSTGSLFYYNQTSRTAGIPKRGFHEITIVLQNTAVFNTSVYANIAFGLKANHFPKKEIESKINHTLSQVGLKELMNQKADTLSGGEKQRLAIARAMALDPAVLLLDEPTAALDKISRDKIINIIKSIHKKKDTTIIIASHDLDLLLSVSTVTFGLYNGQWGPLSIENIFHGHACGQMVKISDKLEFSITDKKQGEINIVVPPESIVLSQNPSSSSMRNKFKGRVCKLEKEENKVKVWVDIGVPLCSTITYESFISLEINLDKIIWTEFKATSIKCY